MLLADILSEVAASRQNKVRVKTRSKVQFSPWRLIPCNRAGLANTCSHSQVCHSFALEFHFELPLRRNVDSCKSSPAITRIYLISLTKNQCGWSTLTKILTPTFQTTKKSAYLVKRVRYLIGSIKSDWGSGSFAIERTLRFRWTWMRSMT